MSKNLLNSQCQIHKKMCEFMCCYSKCAKRLICAKCRLQHLDIHPAQFIYELSNLAEVHSYNKIDKLKEVLIKEKLAQQTIIRQIYSDFQSLSQPLIDKIKAFAGESKSLIEAELTSYLRSNKALIDETQKQIKKSDTKKIKNDPNKMLQETIVEAEIINRREGRIIENGQGYKWYSDTTKQMCAGIVIQVRSMINVALKLIQNSMKLQRNKYCADNVVVESHHQMSFYKRYHASNQVAIDRIKLEGDVLQSKKMLQMKQNDILRGKKQIKDKVIKISELEQKIQGLSEQLQAWQQKKEREEQQKLIAEERQRKMKQEMLIKNGIIGSNGKSLCFERKQVDKNLFPIILQLVPQPLMLDISNNKLTKEQLQSLLNRSSIQTLKYNFTLIDERMISKFLNAYPNLIHLQLNSCDIVDDALYNISMHFTQRLRVLYLIDNHITDEGLQRMLQSAHPFLEQFYISYNNKITSKSIEVISKNCHELKVLHIAKTQLKQKGGLNIGRYMKQIQQLFIGATQMTKDGFLAICKNCIKLKRLSVVANHITTEVVTQMLLGLKDLEWLDLSYCQLKKDDKQKIQKLKIFNKDLNIIFDI